ncbi:MAG: hypothetical protein KJ653_08100 [Candidatus Thermoplasmatota archaeon]|nr:hypothetical protein [Candidatus Thermoplasmatota archaeon]
MTRRRAERWIRTIARTSNGTLTISIPKPLVAMTQIKKGMKMRWTIEGRVLSLRKIKE